MPKKLRGLAALDITLYYFAALVLNLLSRIYVILLSLRNPYLWAKQSWKIDLNKEIIVELWHSIFQFGQKFSTNISIREN